MTILKTEKLSKTYGDGPNAVNALKPVNIAFNQGEFVSIIGPSGSGKSTLLHLLGGLDTPTTGNVIFEGNPIYHVLSEKERSIIRRRKFGFIYQQFNLIPVLSVEDNITLPLLLDNQSIDGAYIEELLEFLGLTERRKHLPNALSGGEQQRVAIGRALSNKPSIIFADEPTGNLDQKTGKEVINLLHESKQKYNQTLIMITHDPILAATAQRSIYIEDGMAKSKKVV